MNAKAKTVEPEVILAGEIAPIMLDVQSLAEVDKVRQAIAQLKEEYADVPDVTTKKGMKLAMERKGVVVKLRTGGQAAKIAYTKPLYDEKKRVDDMWKDEILPELKSLEDPLVAAINAEKNRIAEEKRIADEAEEARVAGIRKRLQEIETLPGTLITIESIDQFSANLDAQNLELYEEFRQHAEIAIHGARMTLASRRGTLVTQAEESKRLAEQKRQQDEQAALLKRQQDDMAEQQRKLDAEKADREQQEKARIAGHKSAIAHVAAYPEKRNTIAEIDAALLSLDSISLESCAEFADEMQHAVTNSRLALTESRRRLVEKKQADDAAAEENRKAQLKAAQQAGVDAEQARIKDKAARAVAAKAEAKRLKALEPDAEQLRLYVADLVDVSTPELEHDDAKAILEQMRTTITDLVDLVDALDGAKAA